MAKNNNLFQKYICYNEALSMNDSLSSCILQDILLEETKPHKTREIAEKMKDYDIRVNLGNWKSTLNHENIDTKKFIKCNSSSCLPKNISQQDLKKFFSKIGEKSSALESKKVNKDTTHNLLPHLENSAFENTVNASFKDTSFNIEKRSRSYEEDNIEKNINHNFISGRDEYKNQCKKKYGNQNNETNNLKKSLGTRRTPRSDFVPPYKKNCTEIENSKINDLTEDTDERLNNIDPKMIELINNEIVNNIEKITWDDIAGLEYAKSLIKEAIIWPMLRPDIFTGIRRPPKGILFFGPPGTGKTLIGKCIASQSKSKFFNISASSLTSKWIGEGEKMVRALFAVAKVHQPSVIFIDEIDSLLCQRSETEHESSRRLKTEFLVQLDGAATSKEDRILIIGATNRPQELDDAARRRFVRRLYIPLPNEAARIQILKSLLKNVYNVISDSDYEIIGKMSENYSGADMASLCQEACMEPLRDIPIDEMEYFDKNNLRPVLVKDFKESLKKIRPSVSLTDLDHYLEWDKKFGSASGI